MRSHLYSKLRRLSFAGSGLPERMRSTIFAFMGLTAAAGLAFVAIFAQVGFPLLAPAPLPDEPARVGAVAEAEVVAVDRRPRPSRPARRSGGSPRAEQSDTATGGVPIGSEAGSDAAAPTGTPKPEGSAGGGSPSGDGGTPAAPGAPSTPTTPSTPAPEPEPAPSPSPSPSPAPTPAPAPAPVVPSPPPQAEVPVAPPPPPAPPPVTAVAGGPPPHSSAGGNGNGKALGLYK